MNTARDRKATTGCDLGKITVQYETVGEGKPIVMLHGWSLDHTEMMFEMEPHFAQRAGWKRIYLDLPGMGKTPGVDSISSDDQVLEVVGDFIDRIIPNERFVVAGTSYGAYLARGLVFRRGADIDGALLSVPLIVAEETKRNLPTRVVVFKDQAVIDKAHSETISLLEELAVAYTDSTLEYVNALQAVAAPDEKFLERLRKNYAFSFNIDALTQPFQAPALFILGRQDHVCGYRDAWGIVENYPRATFAVLDRAGHLAWGEQLGLCSALVSEWLDRVEDWVGIESRGNEKATAARSTKHSVR
jgi:pimeloyl-ACP methyl ester carboxylesterase